MPMIQTAPGKRARILLVEDNPGDVRLALEAFRECRMKCDVRVVNDGQAVLEILRRSGAPGGDPRPDLILLDLNLPVMDGRQVLGEIKSDPGLRRIPVVVLTTSKAEDDVARSYDLQANAYIAKPVDMDHFVEVIKKIEDFWFATVTLPAE
jgi:chemotaxis family two-component system response regulator Rcp1